jgi:superfamily II DNA/RNA helicase
MKISSIRTVVFDEFDALLQSKAHSEPTSAIMQMLKKRHGDKLQSILCSATASDMIESDILKNYFRPGCIIAMADKDDKLITGDDNKNIITRVSRTVLHGVVHVPRKELALDTIRKILHTEPIPQQVLIFADNARRVDLVVEKVSVITVDWRTIEMS